MTPYDFPVNNVDITVFDTPGLADGRGNEEVYLEKIKEKVTVFDVFIFCTEMNTQRFRNDDIRTVQKLTEAFGSHLWKHAVVVLTFANEVHPPPSQRDTNLQDFFDKRLRLFKSTIKQVVTDVGVSDDVLFNVPFVAAGDLSEPRLPGIHNWLTAFWIATFKRLNRNARPAFLIASIDRFNCFSLSEQDVTRNRLLRRSLTSGEYLGRNQLQRRVQRRSFQGFELDHRDHGNADDNTDSEGDRRPFTRSLSTAETSAPPNSEPEPNTSGNGQGATNAAPTLDLDEPSANEVIMTILDDVSTEVVRMMVERLLPGTGQIASIVFNWVISFVIQWLRNISVNESGSTEEEQEAEVENDRSIKKR